MPTNLDSPERRVAAAKATLDVIDDGYTITGLRMSDPENGENGHVVTLDEDEAETVIAAVRKVVEARTKAKSKR